MNPSSDALLLFALAHVIFEEGLADLGLAADWVDGLRDGLVRMLQRLASARVALVAVYVVGTVAVVASGGFSGFGFALK